MGVERGFSVNEEVECENMKEESVVAQRIVYDHVKNVNGVLNVHMSNQLLVGAANARQKYETYLDKQRQQKKLRVNREKESVL